MDEYETVLQHHTNALRDLKEQPIARKMDDSVDKIKTTNKFRVNDTKNKSSVTTSGINSISGRSSSMPNIKEPSALSDKLSVAGDNAMSPTKTVPSNRKPPKSTCTTSYASILSENQFKPIFNDMQSSVFIKGTPTKDGHEQQCSRLLQSEEEHKSFCAFSGSEHKSDAYPQGDDESLEKQRSGGYVANPLDKQRQRQYERRRNKVIHGASNSLGSRFRGGSEARDLSDIFVYHVASDSTVGDIKTHLKQQDIDVQQMRIDITSNKNSLYRSFRIIAPGKYKEFLMCPEVWPSEGI